MRMILPGLRERRVIDRALQAFFRDYNPSDFRRAVHAVCRYYNLKAPKVEWFEYLDWGKTGGKTYPDGKIHLIHPENWKRGRKYNSERRWIRTVYHELGHYIFWADAEAKADIFAHRMSRGVNGANGKGALASKNGHRNGSTGTSPLRSVKEGARPRRRRRRCQ